METTHSGRLFRRRETSPRAISDTCQSTCSSSRSQLKYAALCQGLGRARTACVNAARRDKPEISHAVCVADDCRAIGDSPTKGTRHARRPQRSPAPRFAAGKAYRRLAKRARSSQSLSGSRQVSAAAWLLAASAQSLPRLHDGQAQKIVLSFSSGPPQTPRPKPAAAREGALEANAS